MPLHPQAQAFVDAIAQQDSPGWRDLPPNTAREVFSSWTDLYGEGPDVARVENISLDGIAARIYQADPSQVVPVVMYFHGGGWVLGDLDSHDTLCRILAAESNCAIISVDYRRAPEHKYPAAFDDSIAATKFVANQGTDLGVDSKRIIVAGDSAGGNLALAVALRARDADGPTLSGQLLIYPVLSTDFESPTYRDLAEGYGLTRDSMKWFWECYLGDKQPDLYAEPPLADSMRGLPKTHVITAEYDVLRSEGEALVARLKADGIPTSHQQYDGMLHGFVHFSAAFDNGRAAVSDCARVLKELGNG